MEHRIPILSTKEDFMDQGLIPEVAQEKKENAETTIQERVNVPKMKDHFQLESIRSAEERFSRGWITHTDMCGRDGFFIHGGGCSGDSSHSCIVIDDKSREMIESGSTLTVVVSNEKGL